MPVTIKTDHKWRNLVYRSDVPASVLKSQFDYLSEDDDGADGFFCYRGWWYHVSDFMAVDYKGDQDPFADGHWDGYANDSYFSGVVVKFDKDCERVMCGTYFS
jgi:hypothetical protein